MRVSIFSPQTDNHYAMSCKFKKYLENVPGLNISEDNYTFKRLCTYVQTRKELDFALLSAFLEKTPVNLTQLFYVRLEDSALIREVHDTFLEFRHYCLNYEDIPDKVPGLSMNP